MHFEKYTKAKAEMLIKHDTRQYKNHSNKCIDPEKSDRNFSALVDAQENPLKRFNEKYKEICTLQKQNTGRGVRGDAVALCEWIVTLPENVPVKDAPKFFRYAAEYFTQRYGSDNVISAQVHMDETTPHMHYNFMPIRDKTRLCAKDLETRQSLSQLHRDMQTYISDKIGYKVNILTGTTPKRNLHIEEYKAKKLIEDTEMTHKMVKTIQIMKEFVVLSAKYDKEYTEKLWREAENNIKEREKAEIDNLTL